jgi:hypothetical protein
MNRARFKGSLERSAASDLWRNTLSQIPTVFGRLIYLSSLRGNDTGAYEHHGLAMIFGHKDADSALRRSHEDAFAEWLTFSLEQQKADLDLYLAALTARRKTVIETWLRLTPYRNLIPVSARSAERGLFLSDFETLLEILRSEYGVAAPDPDA